MLAKKKFEELKQLQNNKLLDLKIIEAIKLDLIREIEINKNDLPKKAKKIYQSISGSYYEVLKNEADGNISYYLLKDGYDERKTRTYKRYYLNISLVEDFDDYYDKILNLTKEGPKNSTNLTYGFIQIIAWIILLIGIIGGVVIMSEVFEIGFATIISTSAFAAILFGIAKIIELISEKK